MTAQAPDWLVYRGRRRMLFSNPLQPYLRNLPAPPAFRLYSTAHRRGYVATWEVRADDTLWLTGLKTRIEEEGEPGIRLVFPDADGPVPATWVSFRLQSPDGRQMRYVHMGYESRYDRETYLTVWRGRLVLAEEFQGDPPRPVGTEATPHLEGVFGPEEGAFLRAILAAPADSAPRLVYADWLDERNDPRGGVIRLAERVRGLDPVAAVRERAACKDVFARGLDNWLWVQVMGYGDLAAGPPAVVVG